MYQVIEEIDGGGDLQRPLGSSSIQLPRAFRGDALFVAVGRHCRGHGIEVDH
jgi:hypothetical protein